MTSTSFPPLNHNLVRSIHFSILPLSTNHANQYIHEMSKRNDNDNVKLDHMLSCFDNPITWLLGEFTPTMHKIFTLSTAFPLQNIPLIYHHFKNSFMTYFRLSLPFFFRTSYPFPSPPTSITTPPPTSWATGELQKKQRWWLSRWRIMHVWQDRCRHGNSVVSIALE